MLLQGACGGGNDDFSSMNLLQETIEADQAASLQIESGGRLDIPAGTFDEETVVIFSNYFTGTDSNFSRFPTATPAVDDLLAGMVVNTPVDVLFHNNITLQFQEVQLINSAASISALTVGKRYRVYRFDFENAVWNQWGSTVATVEAGGETAVATLPTAGMRGFIGSLALFEGLEDTGSVTPTVISGTVRDSSGGPVATDVALYLNIGGIRFPVAVNNGRIPDVTYEGNVDAEIANTVDSAADGSFTMQLGDALIGQLVSIDFGLEDPAWSTQQSFDLLAPATPLSEVETFVVRYGENNLQSRGLDASN